MKPKDAADEDLLVLENAQNVVHILELLSKPELNLMGRPHGRRKALSSGGGGGGDGVDGDDGDDGSNGGGGGGTDQQDSFSDMAGAAAELGITLPPGFGETLGAVATVDSAPSAPLAEPAATTGRTTPGAKIKLKVKKDKKKKKKKTGASSSSISSLVSTTLLMLMMTIAPAFSGASATSAGILAPPAVPPPISFSAGFTDDAVLQRGK